MKVTAETKIAELLEAYPFLVDEMETIDPKFAMLKNKVARATMGKMATLSMVAVVGGRSFEQLFQAIQKIVQAHGGAPLELDDVNGRRRLDTLKAIMKKMHDGEDKEGARAQFNELLKDIDPGEIKNLEQELVKEGMPVEEIQRLCELHVGVFKDALSGHEDVTMPAGHPVHTFQQENLALQALVNHFESLVKSMETPSRAEAYQKLKQTLIEEVEKIQQVNVHYVRKENQIFPFMEKHGITAPPQVMWTVHDQIRKLIKETRQLLEDDQLERLPDKATEMNHALTEMIFKEEKIMFPMILQAFTPEDWVAIKQGESAVGYAFGVEPGSEWRGDPVAKPAGAQESALGLDTGALTLKQLNVMLTSLPLDISFVNEQDEVCYYSAGRERIFPRSPGVIGRKVQHCHPPKSMPAVQKILADFRSGIRDSAEFWISLQGKEIHIRYFAMRDEAGTYMGTLEVTQDITDMKKLQGEKRLLD